MAVDNRPDVGPRLVDLAVNEPFEEQRLPLGVDGDAVEIVLEDVVGLTSAGAMLRDIR